MRPVVRWWLAVCVSCVIAGCSPPAPPPSSQADSGPESARRWLEGNGVTVRSFRGGSGGIGFGFVVGKRNDRLVIATPCHVLFGSGQTLGEDCNAASGPPERIQVSFYSAPENRYSAEITQLPGAVQRDLDLAFVELDQPPGIQPFRLSALSVEDLQSGRRAWSFGRTGEWLSAPPAGTYQQVERERPGRLIFDGLVTPSGSSGSPVLTAHGLAGLVLTNRGNETSSVLSAERIAQTLSQLGLSGSDVVILFPGQITGRVSAASRRDSASAEQSGRQPTNVSSANTATPDFPFRQRAALQFSGETPICPPRGTSIIYAIRRIDGSQVTEEWTSLGQKEGDRYICLTRTPWGTRQSLGYLEANASVLVNESSFRTMIQGPALSSLQDYFNNFFPMALKKRAQFSEGVARQVTYEVVGEVTLDIAGTNRSVWQIERTESPIIDSGSRCQTTLFIDKESGAALREQISATNPSRLPTTCRRTFTAISIGLP